jgi:hypothetical protein
MFNRSLKYLVVIILLFAGCKKDEVNFPVEPFIKMISITPATAIQYSDPVKITIHYEDGDGDLGENNDNVKNCFVTDNRIGITYEYRFKQLAPLNANIPIEGNLNIEMGGQVITDSSSSQTASYTIYIIDRAGHYSNSITTNEISITK